ncbi:hypothetical protein IVG45_11320 [Methylomonas sp. LL1]|uniref:hypothetical protein n=1 Tax=Methylomonas sp. LL1 TaxID=2785785 RepID=UPI0018C3552D|nr:hypothetical protein [Methylomonas sp. LL1]QPK61495.1 hypothetical protein IVG45_11320 [Methylomonas sp. LL1]
MIAKEFNQAISDDKLRERWLKRFLPALVITVIYFVFVSNTLVAKSDQAEQAYKAIKLKGVDEDALPGLNRKKQKLQDELLGLKRRDQEVQAGLTAKAGFLYGQTDLNDSIDKLAQLLQRHRLQIIDDRDLGDKKVAELPRSFADLKNWLSEMLKKTDTVHTHRFNFIGHYADVYEMLDELGQGRIKALPVFLSMKNVDNNNEAQYIGMKAWTLDLWI